MALSSVSPSSQYRSTLKGLSLASKSSSRNYSNKRGGFFIARSEITNGGDAGIQDKLVEMIQLQILEANVVDVYKRGSDRMRRAMEANYKEQEDLRIKKMREFNEGLNKTMEGVDATVHAYETDTRAAMIEIEKQEREVNRMLDSLDYDRPDFFFIPSSSSRPGRRPTTSFRVNSAAAADPQQSKGKRGQIQSDPNSVNRFFLYGGLCVVIGSLGWSTASAMSVGGMVSTSKLVMYAIIIGLLLLQIVFEKNIVGDE